MCIDSFSSHSKEIGLSCDIQISLFTSDVCLLYLYLLCVHRHLGWNHFKKASSHCTDWCWAITRSHSCLNIPQPDKGEWTVGENTNRKKMTKPGIHVYWCWITSACAVWFKRILLLKTAPCSSLCFSTVSVIFCGSVWREKRREVKKYIYIFLDTQK